MKDSRMVSRAFHASQFVKALRYKDEVNGFMTRFIHPTMGVMYEVRLIPEIREQYERDVPRSGQ